MILCTDMSTSNGYIYEFLFIFRPARWRKSIWRNFRYGFDTVNSIPRICCIAVHNYRFITSVVDVQTSYSSTQVQKVLTDKTANTNFGPNMVFNNVKEIHMHYHYNTPNSNWRSHRNVKFWLKLKCEHEHKHVLYMFN